MALGGIDAGRGGKGMNGKGWYLESVVSGGQTGADQAGICAAKFLNYNTGGRVPKGFLTELGSEPWLAEFGCSETASTSYRSRTWANVQWADSVVIFTPEVLTWETTAGKKKAIARRADLTSALEAGRFTTEMAFDAYDLTPGSRYTADLAKAHNRPLCINPVQEDQLRAFLYEHGTKTLMVAGSRESKAEGIYRWVYDFLVEALVPF